MFVKDIKIIPRHGDQIQKCINIEKAWFGDFAKLENGFRFQMVQFCEKNDI